MRKRKVLLLLLGFFASLGVYELVNFHGFLYSHAQVHIDLGLRNGLGNSSVGEMCNAIFARPLLKTNFDDTNRKHIIDRVQLMRLYGHCFLRLKTQPSQDVDIREVEQNLFPMLNFSATEVQNKASGRGIIMSMGSTGVEDLKGLIKVLDLIGNKLPIEVYHKNDIAPSHLASVGFGNQSVKLVDASSLIPKEHAKRFQRFVNKWIPFLLTSFEEIIYMDTDIIPFVNPESLFLSTQYLESQSLFFKDRLIDQDISLRDFNFIKMLYPPQAESELFGMASPAVSQLTKRKHLIESGVVVLNRTQYMPGLVLAASLHFWPEVGGIYWGDKEFFAVGQLASGENKFQLNMHSAGALGLIHNITNPGTNSIIESSVCSIQIAHVDSGLNLLWVNGGLRKCKLGSWDKDWAGSKALRNKYGSKEEMKTDFLSPLHANGLVIPPLVHRSGVKTRNLRAGFLKNSDLGCNGYTWCAYDTKSWPGITIQFNETQQLLYDRIAQIWWSKLNV